MARYRSVGGSAISSIIGHTYEMPRSTSEFRVQGEEGTYSVDNVVRNTSVDVDAYTLDRLKSLQDRGEEGNRETTEEKVESRKAGLIWYKFGKQVRCERGTHAGEDMELRQGSSAYKREGMHVVDCKVLEARESTSIE